MKRVHFIAIGGAAMHNLAIAISKKQWYSVTGSDDEIFEPSYSRLKKNGLLPDKLGWFPEKIEKGLSAVIIGMHAGADNPELLKARSLGLKIYSFPEYLYEQTRSKTRVVVGGSHGKTTTAAMILFVLYKSGLTPDYMVGAQIDGFEDMVKLSMEANIAVFEGDEYLTSALDRRPKFHVYRPHIAVLTGIAWDHINVFPTFENYVSQFQKVTELMEPQGRLVYNCEDENLRKIVQNLRSDLIAFPYKTPPYEVKGGITWLKTAYGNVPLKVFGEHNLQNIEAARLVCRQLGINDEKFYENIKFFSGAANRLEKIAETLYSVAFKDFAHSPSKLRATVRAVRMQYPARKLVACMELHTFSSLTSDFLPQYKHCMQDADIAMVYYNPQTVEFKRLPALSQERVQQAFGDNVRVFTDAKIMQTELQKINCQNTALLLMSSGNFDGINLEEFAKNLIT
ncbi:MAG: peptidoglycan synthetase [Prevotellaceae bacterium]|jgi:UDP-N-acetylmuramate: L-alanyl-gamma-D-glutamyl-meso-diaminopimelate ligase|nr:peptidoglycan synthetase [Prevotellaceae bacterium]